MIVLFLIGSFCTGIYWWGLRLIKEQTTQMMQEQNTSMAKEIADNCRQIRLMKHQLIVPEEMMGILLNYVQEDDEKQTKALNKVQEALRTIWRGNTLIEEVTVLIPYANLGVNTGSSFQMDTNWRDLIAYYEERKTGELIEYEDKLLMLSSYLGAEYYVCVELNKQSVDTYITRMNNNRTGNSVLYNIKTKGVLGSSLDKQTEKIFTENIEDYAFEDIRESDGYLFCLSRVEKSDYYCITFAEHRNVYGKLNDYRNFYIILLLVICVSGIIFIQKMLNIVHKPIQILKNSLENVTNGNLDQKISYQQKDEFQYIYDSFNKMVRRLRQLIDKNYGQEMLLQRAQLKQLQTQISPHFFANNFIILSNRIGEGDYEFASEFSRLMGQYFIFVMRNEQEFIPLGEELGHAITYMKIQSIRYRKRITAHLEELAKEHYSIKVPRLIIQPIFENIFKYVVDQSNAEIRIYMRFVEGDDSLKIVIENSGDLDDEVLTTMQSQVENPQGEIHGMTNIHQRLQLVYQKRGGISLEKSKSEGGLKVSIQLLKELGEEEV
jgi:Predicted signal transduction protein with a C-terminal ATPase domain